MTGWPPGAQWPVVPLRRLFKVVNGGTPTADEEYWDGGVCWVTPEDLSHVDGGTIDQSRRTITEAAVRSTNANLVPPGSLVVSTRAPIGYVARADVPTSFNQGCRALVPTVELDERFFRYQLLAARQPLTELGRGSTFTELAASTLGGFPVVTPPLDEQRRISDQLDRATAVLDDLTANLGEMQERMADHQAAWLYDTLHQASYGAQWAKLKYVADRVTVGIVYQPARLYVDEGGVPALRGTDIRAGEVIADTTARISEDANAVHRKSQLWAGDVVVVRTGQAGAAAVVPSWAAGGNCVDLLVVSPGAQLRSKFLELFLNSAEAERQVQEGVVGAVQGHFNVAALRELQIPVIPVEEQDRLVARAERYHQQLHAAQDAMRRGDGLLEERRDALITSAVTGQLDTCAGHAA